MIAQRQEGWLILPLEPDEEPDISVPAGPDAELRRKWLFLVILILTIAMIVVAQNDRLVQTGYELVKMKEYAAELEKENQTLRIDIAKLKSPERIGDIATQELGLVLLDEGSI